jgi:hypothetical protein
MLNAFAFPLPARPTLTASRVKPARTQCACQHAALTRNALSTRSASARTACSPAESTMTASSDIFACTTNASSAATTTKTAAAVKLASTTNAKIRARKILADRTRCAQSPTRERVARAREEWFQVQPLRLAALDHQLFRALKIATAVMAQLASMTSADQFAPTTLDASTTNAAIAVLASLCAARTTIAVMERSAMVKCARLDVDPTLDAPTISHVSINAAQIHAKTKMSVEPTRCALS